MHGHSSSTLYQRPRAFFYKSKIKYSCTVPTYVVTTVHRDIRFPVFDNTMRINGESPPASVLKYYIQLLVSEPLRLPPTTIIYYSATESWNKQFNFSGQVWPPRLASVTKRVLRSSISSRMGDHPGFIVTNPRHTYTCSNQQYLPPQLKTY